jgi:hypothetical protein
MTGETENLILEHLRLLRSGQEELLSEVSEIKKRLTTIDGSLALVRTDIAQLHTMYAGLNRRMDRVERIERRLDLVEEPQA